MKRLKNIKEKIKLFLELSDKKRAVQRKVVLFEKIVYNILVLTPKQTRKDYIYEHA
mgnify:CR=1 FL=1